MFESLKGKTIINILGLKKESECVFFEDSNHNIYVMYHAECYEEINIEDVIGDINDLIGQEILLAEVTSHFDIGDDGDKKWTYYKLGTLKGYVDIRWYGSSNGYYGVDVDFEIAKDNSYSDEYRRLMNEIGNKEIEKLLEHH